MPVKVNEKKLYESVDTAANIAREALRAVAKEAVQTLVGASPIWSGSYLASHRVVVGETTPVITEGPTNMQKYSNPASFIPDQLSDMEGQALQMQVHAKLDQKIDSGIDMLPNGIGVVVIGNSIEHADDVERGNVALNVPVYAVYHATIWHIRTFARQITAGIKQKITLMGTFGRGKVR
jgi:hypothetical protein